jgi:hypothetical protein
MRHEMVHRNQESTSRVPPPTGGGSWCDPYFRSSDVVVPGCGAAKMPICDVEKVGTAQRAIAVGAATITIAPVRTNYFQPLAFRIAVTDAVTVDINRRCEIFGFFINQFPQEAFSNPAVVGGASCVLSDDYVLPDGYGVPVAWGIFSQAALINVLTMQIVNPEPAGTTINVYSSVYGNALDVLPPGWAVGQPFFT